MVQGRREPTVSLSSVRLFLGLDTQGLQEVLTWARRVERERNQSFFLQGEEAGALFVIRAGRVKVSQLTPEGQQIVVRYAGAGEIFGCVPLYGGREYPATATAVIRSEAWAWNRRSLDHLMERYPRIAINALELLGEELAQIRSRYQELATERVERRVARALVRLAAQAGKQMEEGVLLGFPVSRQDLAELTGTTLHTVSRILSAWEQRGILRSGRQRIVIVNPRGLMSLEEDLEPDQIDRL